MSAWYGDEKRPLGSARTAEGLPLISGHVARRRRVERVAVGCCVLALALALLPLLHILYTALSIGGARLRWSFFSQPAGGLPYIGTQGGVLNGLVGTTLLLFLGGLIAVPFGVTAGIYLAEFGYGPIGGAIRALGDTLLGVPSVVWGLFGFIVLSNPISTLGLHWNYSALAGGVILGLIMTPIVARVTELSLHDVPHAFREASLALGATRWATTWRIGLRVARPGILTGVLLALTNALGQTVALLLTNGYTPTMPQWPPQLTGLGGNVTDMASLIYLYLSQPSPALRAPAEAAVIVLMVFVAVVSALSRLLVTLGRSRHDR